jgi:hypothetical protein
MDPEKKEFGLWWMWVLVLVVAAFIVLAATGSIGRIFGLRVEREALVQSHQYNEARKSEEVTYRAELAQLEARLGNPAITEAEQVDIQAQIAGINVLLDAARRRR